MLEQMSPVKARYSERSPRRSRLTQNSPARERCRVSPSFTGHQCQYSLRVGFWKLPVCTPNPSVFGHFVPLFTLRARRTSRKLVGRQRRWSTLVLADKSDYRGGKPGSPNVNKLLVGATPGRRGKMEESVMFMFPVVRMKVG